MHTKILRGHCCNNKTWAEFKTSHFKLIRRYIQYLPSLEISDLAFTHCPNSRTQLLVLIGQEAFRPFPAKERLRPDGGPPKKTGPESWG